MSKQKNTPEIREIVLDDDEILDAQELADVNSKIRALNEQKKKLEARFRERLKSENGNVMTYQGENIFTYFTSGEVKPKLVVECYNKAPQELKDQMDKLNLIEWVDPSPTFLCKLKF